MILNVGNKRTVRKRGPREKRAIRSAVIYLQIHSTYQAGTAPFLKSNEHSASRDLYSYIQAS